MPDDFVTLAARQAARHIGKNISQHREQRGVLFEIGGVHLINRVGLRVMPVEIVLAGGNGTQARHAFCDDRTNVRASSAVGYLGGLNRLKQLTDFLAKLK